MVDTTYTVPDRGLLLKNNARNCCKLPINVLIDPVKPSSSETNHGDSFIRVSSNRKIESLVKLYNPLGISPNIEFLWRQSERELQIIIS